MNRKLIYALVFGFALAPGMALAQAASTNGAAQKSVDWTAVAMFFFFIAVTLGITYWAAKRTKTASQFYAAGGGITGLQNGLAIAGDYMSAASFLGIAGLVYAWGYDGLIFSVGWLVGWPIVTFLIAEPLRNLGRFTFADVAAFRFEQTPVRVLAACGTLVTVAFYMIAQVTGAGALIKILFGLDYAYAVVVVGVLMIVYVTFGGMIATTWVQIIKACLLLGGATLMAVLVLASFGFNPGALFAKAVEVHPRHGAIMGPIFLPGAPVSTPLSAISTGLALMFGTCGLPHILMRFFTVPNAREARKSVFYATGFIGYFYILTFIIGFGAIVFVSTNPDFIDSAKLAIAPNTVITATKGFPNMPAPWLAKALGGDVLFGFISAVAFATILAVVSGLTLAGASAISHDLYATVFRGGKANEQDEIRVSRIATVCLGIFAILIGILSERLNVAFAVGLAFAIAASCNFPVLLMSMFWKDMTTRGAVVGGTLGLVTAALGVILSPAIWERVFGNAPGSALVTIDNPTLFSMSLAFIGIYVVSKMDTSARAAKDRGGFAAQFVRSQTGIGAEGAASH